VSCNRSDVNHPRSLLSPFRSFSGGGEGDTECTNIQSSKYRIYCTILIIIRIVVETVAIAIKQGGMRERGWKNGEKTI
jgi:hypothetical protein